MILIVIFAIIHRVKMLEKVSVHNFDCLTHLKIEETRKFGFNTRLDKWPRVISIDRMLFNYTLAYCAVII